MSNIKQIVTRIRSANTQLQKKADQDLHAEILHEVFLFTRERWDWPGPDMTEEEFFQNMNDPPSWKWKALKLATAAVSLILVSGSILWDIRILGYLAASCVIGFISMALAIAMEDEAQGLPTRKQLTTVQSTLIFLASTGLCFTFLVIQHVWKETL